jgi:signal transduction histidine kinase
MKLRSAARLLALLCSAAGAIVLAAFLLAQREAASAAAELSDLSEFKSELAEFRSVGIDHLTRGGQRALIQATAKAERLKVAIDDIADRIDRPDAQSLVDIADIRGELQVGTKLVLTHDSDMAPDAASANLRIFLLHTQSIISSVDKLRQPRLAQQVRSSRVGVACAYALVLMLALLTVLVLAFLERGVLEPLSRLERGLADLGNGNFDQRLNSVRRDEIGHLARAFDLTLDRLQHITVSRDRLQQEVDERIAAQRGLAEVNAALDLTVAQRTASLASANKELEAFAYSVSHDLRAPLRAIDGFGRKLETSFADALGDEGRRQIGIIRSNTQRMGQLIDDLLSFSRMGRRDMVHAEVDMLALLQEVAQESCANEKDRKIDVRIDSIVPARGDGAMLRQVWVNLLSNAVKFTRPRPQALIEVGSRRDGGELVYWVRDNGVGFDMQYADKLFGVFQRLHGMAEFEGTGVGLALSQRIILRHGGRIWADAQLERGATFYFSLPADSADVAATT